MAEEALRNRDLGSSRLAMLSVEDCEKLHEVSLEILESTGARIYEEQSLGMLREAGAEISDGNLVKIPADLVERSLSTVPKEVVLHDRAGNPAMRVGGYRTYYGPGSDLMNIIDHRKWERRRAVLQDVVEGMILCDALENIDFVMSLFLPSDVNGEIADRYQMEVMLKYTTKPILAVTYDLSGCQDIVEMAELVAGGKEALREKPMVLNYINVTSSLRHNEEALEKLLYLIDKGLPAIYLPGVVGGLTGPVTIPGSMALKNVGALVGIVISQLRREGAPIVIGGDISGIIDMKTMVKPYVYPHGGKAESLIHYYDLPMFTAGGFTDSKLVDQQAGIEAALTLLPLALSRGNIVHDLGYMESGRCGSLAQIAICEEIVRWVKHMVQPLEISDETLQLDLIKEIGPDGQYLDTEHTLKHFRERWYPDLFERDNLERWLAKGGKDLAHRAGERVEKILSEHAPPLLPDELSDQLHSIVMRADERVVA